MRLKIPWQAHSNVINAGMERNVIKTIFQHALPAVIEDNEIKCISLLMILFILINCPNINPLTLLGETRR